ncbi:hypothetical protein BDC45DRAFT_519250 [Circinella umbellata]|nr:hypothetical protein BDC45DRAFT_519250 [Circinella umbellata]
MTNFPSEWFYIQSKCSHQMVLDLLDIQGGVLENDKQVIQYKRKMIEDAQNQRWHYREDGVIYPKVNLNLDFDIRTKPGTVVLLYSRKYSDNENHLWDMVPYNDHNGSGSSHNGETPGSEDGDYLFSSASYAL